MFEDSPEFQESNQTHTCTHIQKSPSSQSTVQGLIEKLSAG